MGLLTAAVPPVSASGVACDLDVPAGLGGQAYLLGGGSRQCGAQEQVLPRAPRPQQRGSMGPRPPSASFGARVTRTRASCSSPSSWSSDSSKPENCWRMAPVSASTGGHLLALAAADVHAQHGLAGRPRLEAAVRRHQRGPARRQRHLHARPGRRGETSSASRHRGRREQAPPSSSSTRPAERGERQRGGQERAVGAAAVTTSVTAGRGRRACPCRCSPSCRSPRR